MYDLKDPDFQVLDVSTESPVMPWAHSSKNSDAGGANWEGDVGNFSISQEDLFQVPRCGAETDASSNLNSDAFQNHKDSEQLGNIISSTSCVQWIPPQDSSLITHPSFLRQQMLLVTPSTRIYHMAPKYKVVIVVDVSASMRTVDYTMENHCRVMVSYVFELLS